MKIETNERGELVIKEVYSGVLMETSEGNKIAICMRDDTFEINVIDRNGKDCWHRVDMQSLTIKPMASHAFNEVNKATCKGSFKLGTACGHCPKCEAQIESGQAIDDSHYYVKQNSRTCHGSMALGTGCGVCEVCRKEQRELNDSKPRNVL